MSLRESKVSVRAKCIQIRLALTGLNDGAMVLNRTNEVHIIEKEQCKAVRNDELDWAYGKSVVG